MFCMSLLKKANRDEFKADEARYLDRSKLTSAQREAILKRQWNRMLELGGNIYFAAKLGATDGLSFQQVASSDSDAIVRREVTLRAITGRQTIHY